MARTPLTETQRNIGSARRAELAILNARAANAKSVREHAVEQRHIETQQRHTAQISRDVTRHQTLRDIQLAEKRARQPSVPRRAASNVTSGASNAIVNPVRNASKPIANPIMMIVFFIVGLSLLYLLVTHGDQTSGFVNGLSLSLSKLSQTTPLFTKEPA